MLTQEHNPYVKLVKSSSLGTDIRLRVYEPDGETTRGVINDALEIEVYDRQGQTPTLTVKATAHTPNTRHLLAGPCIVAVEMMLRFSDNPDFFSYNELRNMRFVIVDVSHDRSLASDPTDTYTFKGVGMLHLFEGARVMLDPQPQPAGDEEQANQKAEKRSFIDATPGSIVWTLFDEARARGELLPLQLGFDAETDSFGNPWPTVSREYSPSTSLRTVISNMLESGLAEFWMHQGVLYMALIDEWDRHYRQTTLPLPYIRDLTPDSAPETTAYSDLISRVLLIGDEGYTREKAVQPDPYLMPFGGRTMVLEAGGVSTDEDADRMIDRALIEGGGATRTYTRDWTYAGDQSPMGYLPFRDFNPGDWLNCDIDGEPRAKMQVRDMSLKRSGAELKASVTLGSLRDDLLTRLARQAQALSDGAAVASTGRPKPVAGGGEYDAHPGQKVGLKVTDKAGGLKAYRTPDGSTPQERNTSLEVNKDNGDVTLRGFINTSKTTFSSSELSYNTPKDPFTLEGHGAGSVAAQVYATRSLNANDSVALNTVGWQNSSVVGTYNGATAKAVLGAAVNPSVDRNTGDGVAGVIAEVGEQIAALYLQGKTVNISGNTTVSGSLSAGSVTTGDLKAASLNSPDDSYPNHIKGFTRIYDDLDVDGLITGKVKVTKPNSYAKQPMYAVYVDEHGKLYRAHKATPGSEIRAT